MKKKILFMVINLNIGGTEKALLNMIEEMPRELWDITILMLEPRGGFLNSIPDDVEVKLLDGYSEIKDVINRPPLDSVKALLRQRKFLHALRLALLVAWSRAFDDRSVLYRYFLRSMPREQEEYEISVAYAGPMELVTYYVATRIRARHKIQWIHFDVSRIGFNRTFAARMYKKFDKVFAVSEEGRRRLLSLVPSLKERAAVFRNIVSASYVNSQAQEGRGFADTFDGLRILTVGRLSEEKGQDLAIRAMAYIVRAGYNVRWYCVGEGSSRERYEELVRTHDLDGKFILLGADPNPYRYMEQCDIYVQPSRHEGYCITLAEAKCLNKPIVTTDFTGAREQIADGHTGLIVQAEEEELGKAVRLLLDRADLRTSFSRQLSVENKRGRLKSVEEEAFIYH